MGVSQNSHLANIFTSGSAVLDLTLSQSVRKSWHMTISLESYNECRCTGADRKSTPSQAVTGCIGAAEA